MFGTNNVYNFWNGSSDANRDDNSDEQFSYEDTYGDSRCCIDDHSSYEDTYEDGSFSIEDFTFNHFT